MPQNPILAVQAGADYSHSIFERRRKTDAYNELNKVYGPSIAYDPVADYNAGKASVQRQTAGTQVQQAEADLQKSQLENQDTLNQRQRMAAYRAAAILKGSAGADGTVSPDMYDRLIVPNAGLLGLSPEQVAPLREMLTQPGGAGHLDSFMQGMIGPTKITGATAYGTDANGNPVAVVRDQYGNIIQQNLGGTRTTQQQRADQGQQNADTGVRRARTGEVNARTNAYRAGTTANNSQFGNPNGDLPLPGVGGYSTQPMDEKPSRPQPGRYAMDERLPPTTRDPGFSRKPPQDGALFYRLPPKGKQTAIGNASSIVNAGTQLATTNQILDTVDKQISPYTAGTGVLLNKLPGSLQTDLKANLKTLSAQGLTAWINSLKNSQGQTGIGRILQTEANAAMTLFGNMEQDQSAKQLAYHAKLFRQTVNKLHQHATQGFKAMYGVEPHEAAGTDDPMAAPAPGNAPQFQEGVTYTDAKGNRATYRGGKFVPVQ
jgi:hypothetical protein